MDLFQSTHPSGVRRAMEFWTPLAGPISIHAPQWGATHIECGLDFGRTISIHAPQWGATGKRHLTTLGLVISIHAPQWGATHGHGRHPHHPAISIHAPQWGATRLAGSVRIGATQFQSTHPSGVRPQTAGAGKLTTEFQSTHPSGVRRTRPDQRVGARGISIHAPQWGATARMGIAFHNMEAPSVLKTDFIAKIHVHRSIHKFSNQKHQQTIHF